jgi:hypothetical protein
LSWPHRSQKRAIQFVLISLLAVVPLAGCESGQLGGGQGYAIHVAFNARPITAMNQFCQETLVALAYVTALGPSQWNTTDGNRPANLDASTLVQQGYEIETTVSFTQTFLLVDHRGAQPTRGLVIIGGVDGADSYQADGAPRLITGDRYLLVFGPTYDASAHAYTTARLMITNAYPVNAQQQVVLPFAGSAPQAVTLNTLFKQLSTCAH